MKYNFDKIKFKRDLNNEELRTYSASSPVKEEGEDGDEDNVMVGMGMKWRMKLMRRTRIKNFKIRKKKSRKSRYKIQDAPSSNFMTTFLPISFLGFISISVSFLLIFVFYFFSFCIDKARNGKEGEWGWMT